MSWQCWNKLYRDGLFQIGSCSIRINRVTSTAISIANHTISSNNGVSQTGSLEVSVVFCGDSCKTNCLL